ncbi:hypothetical protein PIB30_040853 [Stylosanthes scabra]|uniref:Condensation domain-containing protein n=1 Tax=Stylosanthes scabra TaxID=79078 RepID=A0ABU6ZDG0_9FABA|nr:hypothetical protein [Stylosanthes scabra]
MSSSSSDEEKQEELLQHFTTRAVGGTEYSWCKAVPGGTGITVLGLLLSKPPHIPKLQSVLRNLQNSNPILRSTIHFDSNANSYHFQTPPTSNVEIHSFDLQFTSEIPGCGSGDADADFHLILEHELNRNTWRDPSDDGYGVLCVSVYAISESRWGVFLRLHTSGCDRAAAVTLLRELLEKVGCGGEINGEAEEKGMGMAIEDLIPVARRNKPFWARGLDMLGYSLNSFRLGNLDFVDADSPRSSKVVRLQLDAHHTRLIVAGCKSREIKLCAALAAAGMIAARASKNLLSYQTEKYGVVTLIDCRSLLDPVLSSNHLGFYHSAILNTHDVCGEVSLWDLAKRSYMAFANAMNCNKHFSDMSDLNYLMCKAIENPGLTPSSSMRTALISVFEDPVIDDSSDLHTELGLEDYVGSASAHGVGPSIAIFDTIRNGMLDCACVYPSPLHSK